MIKSILFFASFFISLFSYSQIRGSVKSSTGEVLSVVNIYLDNTYQGTTSNNEGNYELNLQETGKHTVVFQYLGYKTLKKTVDIKAFPFVLDAILFAEEISLSEVVINSKENPANRIIRNTIDNRKKTLEKFSAFKADFYSRGLIQIKNAPEKILGQDVGDLGGGLDSTRSGIIYLSETISKLEFKKPERLKEKILASKISGDDNGFSFNTAIDVNFNFYDNTFELGREIVSPISDMAFNYYRYKLEGVFYDDRGNLINKIKITHKRENDKAFSGIIYIVEDHWNLYAVNVQITGKQAQIPPVDTLSIQQTFSYSTTDNVWALISQTLDFKYGILGIKGDGRFTAVYSNYNFKPEFNATNFSREILSFEENSNKKDSVYWNTKRPVPLSQVENSDYIKKDSLQIIKQSKPYLDSIDRQNNRFRLGNLLGGYSYQNSHKNFQFNVESPIGKTSFNTVQGWNPQLVMNFRKNYDEFRRYLSINSNLDYSEAEDRLRATASLRFKFNNISRRNLWLRGGIKVEQYNATPAISRLENLVSTLFFEDNYAKFYEKRYALMGYSEELFNGVTGSSSFSYEYRKTLFNNSDYNLINESDDQYTSNNPLSETGFNIPAFDSHKIFKFKFSTAITFAQDYLSYPNSKFNIPSRKYPKLALSYEKGFGATDSSYNFDLFKASLSQNISVGNKGDLRYLIKGGLFSNADDIAFMDYHHFNGNQTHVKLNGSYLNAFKNLPYYSLSTNKAYTEAHIEHNFKGYLLNKIPLLSKMNYNLVLSTNAAFTKTHKPYVEYAIGIDNLGFGKLRFLRVDYVRSYQNGFINDAVLFGISF